MKNKIIVICLILSVIISLMSFIAVLSTAKNAEKDSDIDADESTSVSDDINFTWDGTRFTVPKGTTVGEFVLSQTNDDTNEFSIGENKYLVGVDCIEYWVPAAEVFYTTCIPNDTVIIDGESYGNIEITFSIDGTPYTCYKWATWEYFVSEEGQDLSILNDEVLCLGCNLIYKQEEPVFVLKTDLLIDNGEYISDSEG